MISEEKVKIMAEMAKYEKNYGKGGFPYLQIYQERLCQIGEDQDKHCLVNFISDHDRIVVYHAVRYCDHEAERR